MMAKLILDKSQCNFIENDNKERSSFLSDDLLVQLLT